MPITRREFLTTAALTAFATISSGVPICTTAATSSEAGEDSQRLLTGWEHCRGALGGIWDAWRLDSGDQIEWHGVKLPHCFNSHDAVDPDEPYYQGPGWYRNKLKIANPFSGGRTLLQFEGAGQKTEVFVYLENVGQHVGGYDEFVVDITEAAARILRDPRNGSEVPVAVMCDNSRDLEMIPSGLNDFDRVGGLYRYVNLVYVPAVSLERVHINVLAQPLQPAKVTVKVRLYNPTSLADDIEILVRVFDPQGRNVYSSSQQKAVWTGEHEVSMLLIERPDLWSPVQRALYRCEVTLTSRHGTTTTTESFGIRYFEFIRHGPFKLNGERFLLRGTHREEDHAGFGAAVPDDLVKAELLLIKQMGANFIVLGHHQQSRLVLQLCDELGLLVLEEIPWSRGGLGDQLYRDRVHQALRALIDQHYNHPSIIIWGLGNENDWPGDFPEFRKTEIRDFVRELHQEAHALDPLRKTLIRRCEFAKDIVDVYSPSIWAGWYHGPYTDYRAKSEEEMQRVDHFLHLEWGADSHAGRHSENLNAATFSGRDRPDSHSSGAATGAFQDGDWSETYACNVFDWHLKEQEKMDWLTGTAQWIFKDFATPLRPSNPIPFVNQKGLAERDLTLKEGYFVFQSYWASEPVVHIYGHSWPVRGGAADEEKAVRVYSNCDSVELFLNRNSCGIKRRNSQDFPAAGLRWMVKFRSGKNQLRATGTKDGTHQADELAFEYLTTGWREPARLEVREAYRNANEIVIEVQALDTNGVLCLDARNRVRFGITGDGSLIDDLGTTRGSRCVELSNGRARISLLTNGGKSTMSVRAHGLPTAFFSAG